MRVSCVCALVELDVRWQLRRAHLNAGKLRSVTANAAWHCHDCLFVCGLHPRAFTSKLCLPANQNTLSATARQVATDAQTAWAKGVKRPVAVRPNAKEFEF